MEIFTSLLSIGILSKIEIDEIISSTTELEFWPVIDSAIVKLEKSIPSSN